MSASTELILGDADGQHVLIRPLSRRHPGLFDHRDANWIECECRIAAGAFRGDLRADLRSEELGAFLDGLRTLAGAGDGLAALTPMEGQIALTLESVGAGRVRVSGEAIDGAGDGNRLQFHFDVSVTSLPEICESLERVLAVFPIVATPDA